MSTFARSRRTIILFVTAALVALVAAPVTAQEDEPSPDVTGIATGATTVLGLSLPDLLDLRLVGEDGLSSTDSEAGSQQASTALSPLDLVAPALGTDLSVPPVVTSSTSGSQSQDTTTLDLATLAPGLLDGAVNPAALSAIVDGTGARGLLTTTVADLSVLGGLTRIASSEGLLGTASSDTASVSARNLNIDELTVIDLGGLLQLLGLDLSDLPLDTLLGLVDDLGVLGALETLLDPVLTPLGLDGLASISDLGTLLDGLLAVVDTGTLTDPLCQLLQSVVCGVLEIVDVVGADPAATLTGIIDGILATLDGAALVSLDGVEAGTIADARPTVEDSVAQVTATLGSLRVAGTELPIPVDATVDQVLAVVDQAIATLDAVLGSISPELAGLIDLDLLDTVTDIAEDDGIVSAVAGLTVLRLGVAPPDVCALVDGLLGGGGLGADLPDGLGLDGLALPDTPVTEVLGQLGSLVPCDVIDDVTALAQPLTVTAGEITNTSVLGVTIEATPTQPAPGPAPTLPVTGSNDSTLLLAGLALASLAGLTRRLLAGGRQPA